jgi:hypothetical protein
MEPEITVPKTDAPEVKGNGDLLDWASWAIEDIFYSLGGLVTALSKGDTRGVVRATWRLGSPRRWAFLLPGGGALTGARVPLPTVVKAEAVADTKPAPPPPPAPRK